ncbi:MAG: DUF1456 family protein [Geobacteraceae bacterium]|nr:DUF1456 family protein [Geobacteraceae bacterium]
MANNELLRSIRDALELDTATMLRIFRDAGREVGESAIAAFLKNEDEDGYIPCSNPIMGFFLDGLIIHNRGRQEGNTVPAEKPLAELGSNAVLKKLRIALDLKEDDLIEIFSHAGIVLTKHELTALFRKPGHKHYKPCTDKLLSGFIRGVALRRKA